MESLDTLYSNFMNVYKSGIEKINRRIINQLTTKSQDAKISVEIQGSFLTKTEFEGRTACLKVSFESLYIIFESLNNSISLIELYYKAITHEFLHSLLCNFNGRSMREFMFVSLGYRDKSSFFVSEPINSMFKIERFLFVKRDNHCEFFDKNIYHLACDLCINESLDMPGTFARAKNFGLPSKLNQITYYAILMYCKYGLDEKNENFPYFDHIRIKFIAEHYIKAVETLLENHQSIDGYCNSNPLDKCNSVEISDNTEKINRILKDGSNGQSKMSLNVERLKNSKVGVWKDFNTIFDSIKFDERWTKLSLVGHEASWIKFNNRKEDNSLIYPGKMETKNGFTQKFSNSSVIFVDISGSMSSFRDPLYTFVYLCLNNFNIRVALYNSTLLKTLERKDFKDTSMDDTFAIGGGTDIINSYKQYIEQYGPIRNIYILTDGIDDGLSYMCKELEAKVFAIYPNGIKRKDYGN